MSKIRKGLKLEGSVVKIPQTARSDLLKFFNEMGIKEGVEVGVYTGSLTKHFAKGGLIVHGVDPWMVYPGFDRMNDARKERQEQIYKRTSRRLRRFKNVTLIRKMSMDAVTDFEDESLDFVYIDGNHDFRYVAEDIFEWEKKIKRGGIVSGHDYNANVGGVEKGIFQVRPVIDAYVKAFKIKKLYIIGDRDHASSWFWIKK